MVDLQRVARGVVIGLLLVVAAWLALGPSANAAFPKQDQYAVANAGGTFAITGYYATREQACPNWAVGAGYSAPVPLLRGDGVKVCRSIYTATGAIDDHGYMTQFGVLPCPANSTTSGSTCTCNAGATETVTNSPTFGTPVYSCVVPPTCPANSTWNGTTCACNSGYSMYSGACTQNCAPNVERIGYIGATQSPATVCIGSCESNIITATNQCAVDGVQKICGVWYQTGNFCSGSTASVTLGAPSLSCKAGTCPGTVNGQTTCLPCTSSNPATNTSTNITTTTSPTGETTKSTTTTATDDGSKATSSSSTTTTVTPAGGGTPTTTTATQTSTIAGNDPSRKDEVTKFCEQNPNSPICKASSWGGSCGGFTCEGDAVQCAIARDQYQRNCQLFDQTSPQSDLANQIIAGNDPGGSANPAALANRASVSMSGTISQTPFLSGGGLSDQTVSVYKGTSVVLPWSSLNQYLSIMGSIVVAFALIFAVRVVLGKD